MSHDDATHHGVFSKCSEIERLLEKNTRSEKKTEIEHGAFRKNDLIQTPLHEGILPHMLFGHFHILDFDAYIDLGDGYWRKNV